MTEDLDLLTRASLDPDVFEKLDRPEAVETFLREACEAKRR